MPQVTGFEQAVKDGGNPILCPVCNGKRTRIVSDNGKIAEWCHSCQKWQGESEAMIPELLPQ